MRSTISAWKPTDFCSQQVGFHSSVSCYGYFISIFKFWKMQPILDFQITECQLA